MSFDPLRDPRDEPLQPTPEEAGAWAGRERKRREAWLAGPTQAEQDDWVRRHRPELASRIVFITGDTASAETIKLLQQNGTPCIEKPFRVQELMAAVEKTIGKP